MPLLDAGFTIIIMKIAKNLGRPSLHGLLLQRAFEGGGLSWSAACLL